MGKSNNNNQTTYRMDNVLLRITAQSDIYGKAPMAGELIFDWENWNARFTEKPVPRRPPRPYAERNHTIFNNRLGTVLTQNPQTGTYHLECYFDLDGVNDWQKLQSIMSEVYQEIKA